MDSPAAAPALLVDFDVAAGHLLVAELPGALLHDAPDLALADLRRKRVKLHRLVDRPAEAFRSLVVEAETIAFRVSTSSGRIVS